MERDREIYERRGGHGGLWFVLGLLVGVGLVVLLINVIPVAGDLLTFGAPEEATEAPQDVLPGAPGPDNTITTLDPSLPGDAPPSSGEDE